MNFIRSFFNLFRRNQALLPATPIDIKRLRWMKTAYAYVGLHEIPGKETDSKIGEWLKLVGQPADDSIPWCAAACNGVLEESGMQGSGKPNARSFLQVGTKTVFRPGCIVVLWTGSIGGWQGHVGFGEKLSDDGRRIRILGGNQGDEFNSAWFSIDRVLDYRWPVPK